MKLSIQELHQHSGRLDIMSRWLSPIRALDRRYQRQLEEEPLIIVSAFARGVQDICVIMPIDIEPYLHHLDGFDMDDAQKAELIHNISDMMKGFVDQAFGVDSVQQSLAARAKDDSDRAGERIQSKEPMFIDQFDPAAGDGRDGKS